MTRSRASFALVLVAVVALGGGCSRNRPATHGSVEDDVRDRLLDEGYVAEPASEDGDIESIEVSSDDADTIATCVADALFEGEAFTKDERNDVTSVLEGDIPDPDLERRVEDLVHGCYDDAVTEGPAAPDTSSSSSGDEETTTTVADEETTTTEG